MNESKVREFLNNELVETYVQLAKARESLANIIENCGENDIAVPELSKTVEKLTIKAIEIKALLK